MNQYTYIDHGNVAPEQYFNEVVLFWCQAQSIVDADKQCREAGYNPTAWHVGTRVEAVLNLQFPHFPPPSADQQKEGVDQTASSSSPSSSSSTTTTDD